MRQCRFEDRHAGRALALHGFVQRVQADTPEQLTPAFEAIETARQAGHWVALLLDYELGEWLLPSAQPSQPDASASGATGPHPTRPRLRALVFERAVHEDPWTVPIDIPRQAAAGSTPSTHASTAEARSHIAGQAIPAAATTTGSATATGSSSASAPRVRQVIARQSRTQYIRHVEAIRAGIAAGDFYQINATQPLDVLVEGDARALYTQIAQANPSAHAAYIEDDHETVLSWSPELFIERRGERVVTRPMKGTAPRDADPTRDQALGDALRASSKDRAENLMIVDLLRNDLGQLAAPGDVRVDALFTLEAYASVWTLTSTISARLPRASLAQLLGALFPCGSITGAPKRAAMDWIRTHEIAPRGLYCGSIGWLAPNGDLSLNVAIRTLTLDVEGRGCYGVGGGIVFDSDPAREWQECQWKSRVLGHAWQEA